MELTLVQSVAGAVHAHYIFNRYYIHFNNRNSNVDSIQIIWKYI